jgi:hypothetical protein
MGLGACSEQVTSSLGCPQLCVDQSATLRDTLLIGAVVLDSTITGFPLIGESVDLSLVSRGDTADVRLIARFDSLPTVYTPTAPQPDSLIRLVDSATFIFVVDTAFTKPLGPVTIDAFDVDTTAADTVPSTLIPLFRPDRLIGSSTYTAAQLHDTLRLTLDNAAVLQKIANNQRLRIGLRLRDPQSPTVRVAGSLFAPRIRFRVSADSTVLPDTVFIKSATPADDPTIASSLRFYALNAAGTLPPPGRGLLAVGGLAGARSYLRFDIPSIVLDSVQVIRASLELTQLTSRSAGGSRDTLTLLTQAVIAGPAVTDVFTQSQFLAPLGTFVVDTLRIMPGQSGLHTVELVNVVRAWRTVGTTNTTRAIVLRAAQEGSSPGELNFTSTEGPVDQRPRLRLTYVPRRGFGLP